MLHFRYRLEVEWVLNLNLQSRICWLILVWAGSQFNVSRIRTNEEKQNFLLAFRSVVSPQFQRWISQICLWRLLGLHSLTGKQFTESVFEIWSGFGTDFVWGCPGLLCLDVNSRVLEMFLAVNVRHDYLSVTKLLKPFWECLMLLLAGHNPDWQLVSRNALNEHTLSILWLWPVAHWMTCSVELQ